MTCVPSSIQRILIPTLQTLELVAVEDIVSIKAYENYSKIHLRNTKVYTSTLSFGKILSILQHNNFYQCHKSHLVNLNLIVRYHKNGEIEMPEGLKIPVARRRKEEFINKLTQQVYSTVFS